MKNNSSKPILSALIALGAFIAMTACAANRTWIFSPADPTWSNAANWGGTAPAANADSVQFNDSAVTNLDADLTTVSGVSYAVTGITFGTTTNSSYVINNAITLNGTITDVSTQPQKINATLVLTNGTKTISPVPGANLTLGGVIQNYPLAGQNAGITLTESIAAPNQYPSGAGINYGVPALVTLNPSSPNLYTNTTTINAGITLLLDFSNLANPVNLINSINSALTLGGGSYSIKGSPSGTTLQTNSGTLTLNSGASGIILNPNGGAGAALTLGNTWTRNAGGTLNVNTAAGGSLVAVPATVNGVLGYATVTDASGVGFATTNLSNGNIVRYTGAAALASGANSAVTNFTTSGNLTMSAGSFAVNSLTLNAAGGNGVLDLGGAGDVMTNISRGILMTGANNFTIQDGCIATNNGEIIIHQMGTGTLYLNGTIGSGSASLTKDGPGTLVLNGASTNTGTSIIDAGAVQLGISSSTGAGPLGNTTNGLTINAGGALDLNGNNLTVGAFNNGGGIGVVTNSAGGAPAVLTIGNGNGTVAGYNSTFFAGNLMLKVTGTSSANLNDLANAHTGGIMYSNNNTADRVVDPSDLGSGPVIFGGNGGFLIPSANIVGWNLGFSNPVVVNGLGNGWNFQNNSSGNLVYSTGPWSGSGAITFTTSFTPTFNWGGDLSAFAGTMILVGTGGNWTFTYANTNNGGLGGAPLAVFDMQSSGTGAANLQYSGGVTNPVIQLGDLNTTGNTGSGALTLRNNISTAAPVFVVGGLNASSTFGGNIINNVGALGITKIGTGNWTITGSTLSYTGPTTISNGVLTVNGTLSGSPVTVFGPGNLAGNGTINSPVTLNAGNAGIVLTNNGGATFTLTDGLSMSNANVLAFGIGSASSQIALAGGAFTQSGSATVYVSQIAGFGAGTYNLITGASGISAANFTLATTISGYGLSLTNPDSSTLALNIAVAAPATAFWHNRSGALWTTANNWDNDASSDVALVTPPAAPTDVTFAANAANNFNTTLGADFNIHSLTLSTPNNVTIGGANTLTITAGINNSGASNVINAKVILGTDQAWVNSSASPLTVNSNISGAHQLTINDYGSGVALNGVNTYSGGTFVASGILILGNATNTLADTGAVLVDNNGVLALGNNNDTVGVVGVGFGNITGTGGTLTASSFLFTNASVTANLAGSGAALSVNNGSTTLSGTNFFTGAITIFPGATLTLAGNNSAATGGIIDNGTLNLLTSPTAVGLAQVITVAANEEVYLEADHSTGFSSGGISAGPTIGFYAQPALSGASGSTLALYGPLTWSASGTTLTADANDNYNVALGDLFGGNGGSATLNANTANLTINSFTGLGNSSSIIFTGPDNIAVTAGITNDPTKGLGLNFNGTGTVTLWGVDSLTGSGPVSGSAFAVNSGTAVLNNNAAINSLRGNPTVGLITGTGADTGAALLLGGTDANGLAGGIIVTKNIVIEDGQNNGAGSQNIGPMVLGGQNTSGTNYFTGSVTLGFSANVGMSATVLAASGGEVDFTGGILQNGSDTSAGVTVNGSGYAGVVKLLGANTYSGLTTVSNGTLFISSLHAGGGSFVVNDGATLGVTNAQNSSGAQLNSLALGQSGPTTNIFDNVASLAIPLITVTNALTVNGGSRIIITANNAIAAPGEYPLIKYGAFSGAFTLSAPTNMTAMLTNDTANSMIALHVRSVYSPVNPLRGPIQFSLSGSTMTLAWPTNLGWILQSQTNSLAAGLSGGSNGWFDISGSAAATQAVIDVVSTNPTVLYRLRHP